jgi:hypothetical protein
MIATLVGRLKVISGSKPILQQRVKAAKNRAVLCLREDPFLEVQELQPRNVAVAHLSIPLSKFVKTNQITAAPSILEGL